MDRSIPSVRPSLLAPRTVAAGQQIIDAFTDAWQTGVLAPERLRTGCIYEGQPADSYLIAVMRFDPRLSGWRQVPIHEWWPTLAPQVPVLNAYRHLDAHGQRQIQWPEFARRYLAGLDLLPTQLLVDLIRSFGVLPSRYKTVTLLCCEHATAADERRVRCHRRLLRHWLLGQDIPEVPQDAIS